MSKKTDIAKQAARAGSGRKKLDPMEKTHTVTMQVPLKYIADVNSMDDTIMIDFIVNGIANKKDKLIKQGTL